jgi:hypothetical protein
MNLLKIKIHKIQILNQWEDCGLENKDVHGFFFAKVAVLTVLTFNKT